MNSYLIKDTTEEERRKIVEDALGTMEGACDGCSARVADIYEAYIHGEMEPREVNMEFRTNYVKDIEEECGRSCAMEN